LGVADALRPYVGVPDGIRVRDGASGTQLAHLPLGRWIEQRHGAPYWVVHRHDLHAALLQAAAAEPSITLTRGFAVDAIAADDRAVAVATVSAGDAVTGRALIGADGLWSTLRERIFATPPPRLMGKAAARSVVPIANAPPQVSTRDTTIWLMPGAHVVHYPVSGGSALAIVAIVADDEPGDHGWGAPIASDWITRRLPPCAGPLRDLLGVAGAWRKWTLHTLAPTYAWARGRIALLGDAAHPVPPFLAQGGALALEDAAVIARAIHDSTHDMAMAFRRYESARRPRALKVAAASARNGVIYQFAGSARLARDLALRITPPGFMMSRYDWLYGWRCLDTL
jgi:salicylate hydroxylase